MKSLDQPHSSISVEKILPLLDRYASFLQSAGKKVYRTPFPKADPLFQNLSNDQRSRLLTRLEMDLTLFQEAIHAGEELTQTLQLLWRYLNKARLKPCSDIFGKIGPTDIVELYSSQQIHPTFRSLRA